MDDSTYQPGPTKSWASSERANGWLLTVVQTPAAIPTPKRFRINERVTRLNRTSKSGGADLTLEDPAISNGRVAFELRSGELHVFDEGSRNPVRVNGRAITTARLAQNDTIRVGDTLMVLDVDDPARGVGGQAAFQDPTVRELMSRLHMGSSTSALQFQVDACLLDAVDSVVLLWVPSVGAYDIVREWIVSRWDVPTTSFTGDVTNVAEAAATVAANEGLVLERLDLASVETQRVLAGVLADRQLTGRTLITICSDLKGELPEALEALLARVRCSHLLIPPLRDRKSDLVDALRETLSAQGLHETLPFQAGFTERFLAHDWPTGVVELRDLTDRIARAVERGTDLNPAILPAQFAAVDAEPLDARRVAFSEETVIDALMLYRGNMKRVAEHFSLSRPYLYKKLKANGLALDALRAEATRRLDSEATRTRDDID
ncbi:MAG: hypothetical protein ACI81R_002251 [Bradymonadia bacterium]|jgi:hypothetical protein